VVFRAVALAVGEGGALGFGALGFGARLGVQLIACGLCLRLAS
jgi:hypothetical protein